MVNIMNVFPQNKGMRVSNASQVKLAASGFIALAFVALALLLAARLSVFEYKDSPHPDDANLEAVFRQHEAEFNRLVEMSRVDRRVIRIAPDFTWLDDNAGWPRPESELGFPKERWEEYRRLFKQLGLSNGILQNRAAGTTYLIASSNGLVTNGTMKGYAYSSEELSPMSDSLDDVTVMPTNKRVMYKRLKDNWYLFYMSI